MTAPALPAPQNFRQHFRMTKILATLGPSSSSEAEIAALAAAGVAGFRLNFSHGTLADHQARAAAVRAVEQKLGVPLALLMDLQGPKIRVGEVSAPVRLMDGEPLVLDSNPAAGDSLRVGLPHRAILASLQVGDTVLVNDGVIRLHVRETGTDEHGPRAVCEVVAGGILSSRKGVNVPGRTLPMGALTTKDEVDLAGGLALAEEVDWVALSFVQTAADVDDAKAKIAKLTPRRVRVMAKIETQAAVANIAAIVAASDGIMVARGDLGVELPTEDVPPLQKQIVELCRAAGKPVVVATQMVESMVQNPRPTRAEASDVANAACEGADCVMLSAESASGAYPVAAVEVMARIIAKIEQSPVWALGLRQSGRGVPADFATAHAADAVALAASHMALALRAAGLVTFTETGLSTLRLARLRAIFAGEQGEKIAGLPIIALTPHVAVARALAIGWGIRGIPCPPLTDVEDMVAKAASSAQVAGLAAIGEQLVVMAGIPFGQPGSTNLVRIVDVGHVPN